MYFGVSKKPSKVPSSTQPYFGGSRISIMHTHANILHNIQICCIGQYKSCTCCIWYTTYLYRFVLSNTTYQSISMAHTSSQCDIVYHTKYNMYKICIVQYNISVCRGILETRCRMYVRYSNTLRTYTYNISVCQGILETRCRV